ncbi:transmembrane repetitive protein [[Pseudomonas] boreopolis]|uniref:transmembrane repetitive protein n=1 Tax=Xanthomonas boreopolis TaxID=86183 RepID=UPI003D4FF4CA
MTKAADLIDHLLARRPDWPILEKRSGMPHGWGIWMRSGVAAAAPFDGRDIAAHVATLPRPPGSGIAPQLSFLEAFRRLWWQHWDPRPADQRGLHWLGVAGSFLIHVLFLVLLLWVAVVRWAARETEPEAGRVQLSILGRGAPDDEGGGEGGQAMAPEATQRTTAPVRPRSRPAPVASGQASPAATPPTAAAAEAEPASPPAPPVPERVPPSAERPVPPVAVQRPAPMVIDPAPVIATETPVATTDFVVPPPPSVPLREARLAQPELPQVRERQVETVERPQAMQVRPREVQPPTAPSLPVPTVREREVATVDRPAIALPQPALHPPAPTLETPEVAVRQRELPDVPASSPAPAPAAEPVRQAPAQTARAMDASPAATAPAPAASAPASAPAESGPVAAGSTPAARAPGASPGRQAGAGPRPTDRSGGWAAPKAADDWGLGERNQAGRQDGGASQGDGLYNRDGSLRVPEQGQADGGRGAPGSETDHWSRERIAESGTWLKRPPYDYTPTSFDKYWVPNESLLEEWVRKGIKKIEIAIPGTSTKISCVVSMLQFGGGCGLTNPNMNEQPASARPPPDVPFKKELQEDNGSVR